MNRDASPDESIPGEAPGGNGSPESSLKRSLSRRISYFMLFRLVMLSAFTVLAAVVSYAHETPLGSTYAGFVWTTIAMSYAATMVFAWLLPRVEDLQVFAWVQTATDVLLAAVVVQMTGGVDSGFSFLYLIAILGAATMGDWRQIWATAMACALVYGAMSTLEASHSVVPLTTNGPADELPARELWITVARTLAGLLGVTVLSAYLNIQLASSVSQVGSLRVLNENIVRSLSSGLVTIDGAGRVLYFNPMAQQILDVDASSIGLPIDSILPGCEALLAEPFAPGVRHEIAFERHGERMYVGLNIAPLLDANARRLGAVINFQDVTRLYELAQQVRRNERLAAIGGLAASVAHEIRNPLAAISGSAELLASDALGAEDNRLLGIIRRESTRLNQLVTELLAYTRPKEPEFVVVSLATTIRDVCEAFRHDPANAAVTLDNRADEPARVLADPSQLTQILWNLMRNAAEAMRGRGTITLGLEVRDGFATMLVGDDGPGIEHVERVFDPFYTTKAEGTGLGLAVVHRVVEEHKGRISVESSPEGTTFRIALPLVE